MKIQQLIVSVTTQHLQLVVGQRLQQQETHPLQLVKEYRPLQPQLQVSLYVVQVSVACSNVALAAKVTHFCSILLSVIALASIIGGSIGGIAALTGVSIITIGLLCYCCTKKGKQSKCNNLDAFSHIIV